MTARTDADDFVMINRTRCNGCPVGREHRVAGIAVVTGVNVRGVFAAGGNTIVTGNTITDKATVVNGSNGRPVRGDVTVIALKRCC